MIDLTPTKCNLCNGKVIYTSNANIYGKQYGSGYCYVCVCCGAYVGTHKPRPREALGILANKEMRELKKLCHSLFDKLWNNAYERKAMYKALAKKMGINEQDCHFGYFDIENLHKALKILKNKEI